VRRSGQNRDACGFRRFRAVELGLRGGDVFQAIAVPSSARTGFGLSRGGAGFRDFFGTIASLGFFSAGAGLLQCGRIPGRRR